jgi:hypothetical protein
VLVTAPSRRSTPWARLAACWRANPGLTVVVVLALALGLLLRLYALGRGTINSDEAVVGLMARQILHGHFFAFYWAQNYGGTEAYAVAVVFALFGSSAFTLGLTTVLLCAASAAILWRIGNRLFGSPVGAVAAMAFWVWPEPYVTYYNHGDGFRWVVLICGLLVFLTVLRIGDSDGNRLDWLALGLGAGVGWWSSPEMAYFLAPGGVYLVARTAKRRAKVSLGSLVLGIGALGLGSLPWWWHNILHHFDSLASVPQPSPPGPGGAYWWHLGIFDRYVLPIVLGLRTRGSGAWVVPSNLTPHLVNVVIVVLAAWLVYLAAHGRAWLLVLFVAAFPFLYAAPPFTWYWRDARYAIFLAPLLALVVVSLFCEAGMWALGYVASAPAVMAGLALVAALGLTLVAAKDEQPYKRLPAWPAVERTSWLSWHANPNNLPTELADSLVRWHVRYAFSSYWLGYDVGFLSDGRVIVSPAGPGFIRYPPYYRAIAASAAPAWMFVRPALEREAAVEAGTTALDPGCVAPGQQCLSIPEILEWCEARDISYSMLYSGPYVVVIPAERVLPTQILPYFGI